MEDWKADAAAKHGSIGKDPLRSGTRFGTEAEYGAARLLLARMPQEQDRPPRRLCPQAEPPAFGKAECRRIASDFENGRGQRTARRSRLRQPQRLLQLSRRSLEEVLYLETILRKPHRIGQSRLAIGEPVADPQKGRGFSLPLDKSRQRQNKTTAYSGIAHGRCADLCYAIQGQTTIQCCIHVWKADRKPMGESDMLGFLFTPRLLLAYQRGSLAFQFGNCLTQGKKSLLRRGMFGHGVSSIPICSLYVLMDSRALLKSQLAFWEKSRLLSEAHESSRKFPRIDYMSSNKEHLLARIDQTDDWRDRHAPTLSAFESLAIEAYGNLPEEFRALTTNLTIEIEDFPDDEIFEDMALETPFDLLGLFEGRGISERFSMETGELPNRIRLYRRPILDYWAENEETLGDIITHVLIHEIGHHFGLSDDDMERIEASAEEATDR